MVVECDGPHSLFSRKDTGAPPDAVPEYARKQDDEGGMKGGARSLLMRLKLGADVERREIE